MSVKKIIPQILEYVKPAGYSSLTIEVTDNEDKIYYIADINDTFFYRTIEFDDIDILSD